MGASGTVATILYYILFEQNSLYVLFLVFAVPGTTLAGYAYLKSGSVPLSQFRIWTVGAVLIAMGSIVPGLFLWVNSLERLGGLALNLGIIVAAIALNYHVMRKEGTSG